MSKPPEATRHNNSTKLLVLLPLRANSKSMFQNETPCILHFHFLSVFPFLKICIITILQVWLNLKIHSHQYSPSRASGMVGTNGILGRVHPRPSYQQATTPEVWGEVSPYFWYKDPYNGYVVQKNFLKIVKNWKF